MNSLKPLLEKKGERCEQMLKQQAVGIGNVLASTLELHDLKEISQISLVTDPTQQKLIQQLDLFIRENQTITRAYILGTEIDNPSTVTILSTAPRFGAGISSSPKYRPTATVMKAVREALDNKNTSTTNSYNNESTSMISVLGIAIVI